MVLPLSFGANEIKKNSVFRVDAERYRRINGFPALYIDRYSYISQARVRTPYGEPEQQLSNGYVPEGAYALHIGAFCSIAWDNHFVIDQDHDYMSVSMADCELFQTGPSRHRRKGSIIIQNDVWIGQGCTVYGGVTIHNGAVVAGNSVVTKDVPPYCIVGGAPARIIKPRFHEETIQKLLAISWWDWSDEKLRQNRDWFAREPEEFADYFYKPAVENEKAAANIPSFPHTYLFFPDFDEPYGIWQYVVLSFCKAFAHCQDHGLILFVDKENAEKFICQLEELAENIDAECCLYVYSGKPEEEEAAFSRANYYITSRSLDTVRRTCLADRFGIPIISGADIPIF